jgi:ribonucleoside-diphosphate reductase alpha chain
MGLALNEVERERRAIEFYKLLSSFDFMSSTPTLFNSGTLHSQLSSCYLSTISDDLIGIYDGIKENALLSKFAGGLGNDWTPIRAMGAHIKGTNGKSQGVIPFLKVVNDTCVAVNQGGKRKGAACVYLETWHADIEEFLDLRKNTGDDRRRCHDINTANWIPDLFMKRVHEQGEWTLFSPNEVPDLHDKFGLEFEQAYLSYEQLAAEGKIRVTKKIPALQLWRKILTMLFETGHPWVTFKDPCNIRSPQQHVGVVHSSNLCTEITLNTNENEIAVCNLGSVNLLNHLTDKGLDFVKLKQTVTTAMRMLDNVIDINFYPVTKARNSNLRHRPVGLGFMGFQDCLHQLRIPYASVEAVEFADRSMEMIAYNAYWASSELARERGRYASYQGSLWSQGVLPYDSMKLLAEARGNNDYLKVDNSITLDWDALREQIKTYGMRNSNCLAIAPTATISNIIGVAASIEPTYQNIFVKSNLSGEFTVVNEFLVRDLKQQGLWDEVMLGDIKYFDGSLERIERIPADLRKLYATAFEMDPSWLVEAASRRQKWIDQAQSLNLYVSQPSGRKLDELYRLAWVRGLKTTYYLRTLAATAAEKSTGRGGELNAVSADGSAGQFSSRVNMDNTPATDAKFCSIDNPECESCQ